MTRKELCQILENKIDQCQKCDLHLKRNKSVPGEGNLHAELMVIGEGPGKTEDETGRPFVGIAGELLTNILSACDYPREKVFICNTVKCKCPDNRTPQNEEVSACSAFLDLQIRLIKPKLIIVVGSTAMRRILPNQFSVTDARGKFYDIQHPIKTKCYVTFHPSFVLRSLENNSKIKDTFIGDFIEATDYLKLCSQI